MGLFCSHQNGYDTFRGNEPHKNDEINFPEYDLCHGRCYECGKLVPMYRGSGSTKGRETDKGCWHVISGEEYKQALRGIKPAPPKLYYYCA